MDIISQYLEIRAKIIGEKHIELTEPLIQLAEL